MLSKFCWLKETSVNIVLCGQFAPSLTLALAKQHHVTHFPQQTPAQSALVAADILVVRGHIHVSAAFLEQAPCLRLLIKAGAGLDTVDLIATKRRNIPVVTTPASTVAVAELTIALLLALRRKLCLMNEQVRQGNWSAKYQFPGHQLRDSTLGIVGFGRIGREVAQLGHAFGMRILAYDHNPSAAQKQTVAEQTQTTFAELATVLRRADALTLHLPLRAETRHLLDYVRLSSMQAESVLINTARAELVEREALTQILAEGRIAGAALDVFYEEPPSPDEPLFALPHVICTPHIGAQTLETLENMAQHILKTINTFAEEMSSNSS